MDIDPLIFRAKFPESCRLDLCRSRCCRYGVWADVDEMNVILSNRNLFLAHVRPEAADPSRWFGNTVTDRDCPSGMAVETQVVGGACVFYHPGHGCALQKAAIDAGLHEWRYKPRFCILFPLVVSEGTLTVDEDMKSLWCMKEKNRTHPIARSVGKEIRYLFGEELAQALLSNGLPSRKNGSSRPGRPETIAAPVNPQGQGCEETARIGNPADRFDAGAGSVVVREGFPRGGGNG